MFRTAVASMSAAPRRLFSSTPLARQAPASADGLADLLRITTSAPPPPPPASTSSPSTFSATEAAPAPTQCGYAPTALPLKADPVLDLLTNLIMRDGKKAEAQRRVTDVLTFLQRSTNAPPVSLVHQAVALASPSVRMVSMRKRAKTIQQPRALNERQRTHAGVKWILQAAERGRSKTAPRSQRIAREVLAIIDGSSDVVKKLEELHKTAMLNRSNINTR